MTLDKKARERGARALCILDLLDPNEQADGRPMWVWYLDQADEVLRAALGEEAWRELTAAEDGSD